MLVYLAEDTAATQTFYTACATSVDGSGITSSAEEIEPCLSDAIVVEYPGNVKYNQQTIEYKRSDSTSGVSYVMEGIADDSPPTMIKYAIKIPFATPVYGTRHAYIVSAVDMPVERNQDMKQQLVLAPQTAWTYSTTEPSTS